MRILSTIDRPLHVGYANQSTERVLLVDGPLSEAAFTYEAFPCGHGTLYLGHIPGTPLRHFLYHRSTNERGYGGRVFSLRLGSGEVVQVRGPWSSNCDHVRDVTGIALTPARAEWADGWGFDCAVPVGTA